MSRVIKDTRRVRSGAGVPGSLITSINILKNNEFKITYYEVISGASGSLTTPTNSTINSDEFGLSGNCVLSKVDGSNKPTFESPTTVGGIVVTATLNTSTGAWVASGVYTDPTVALIYSIKIKAIDYPNLTYNNIIETVEINEIITASNGITKTLSNLTLNAEVDGVNTHIGNGAGASITAATDNTYFGISAGTSNLIGIQNTAIGHFALKSNTNGTNTAIGASALQNNITGLGNVAIGPSSLQNGTTGEHNIAIGPTALLNTTGDENVGIGYQTLYNNTSGGRNVAICEAALYENVIGSNNIGIGHQALRFLIADSNVALGVQAGYTNSTGSANIFLGNQAGYYETASNKLFIDNQARANEADARIKALIYGVFDAATANQSLRINGALNLNLLTASTVPYLDASKNIVSSSVTPTELGYVSGVTSSIQTQLNAKGVGTILGAITATAGLIPYGTGTADTVTSSAALKFTGTLLNINSPTAQANAVLNVKAIATSTYFVKFERQADDSWFYIRDNTTVPVSFQIGSTYTTTGGYKPLNIQTGDVSRISITVLGQVGIGDFAATAALHIKAGTATASTAPLKFTSGTNLTTAENGAMEYNGTNLFFTRTGAVREGVLTQSAVTTEALTSDTSVTINIGGTTYKLLAKA